MKHPALIAIFAGTLFVLAVVVTEDFVRVDTGDNPEPDSEAQSSREPSVARDNSRESRLASRLASGRKGDVDSHPADVKTFYDGEDFPAQHDLGNEVAAVLFASPLTIDDLRVRLAAYKGELSTIAFGRLMLGAVSSEEYTSEEKASLLNEFLPYPPGHSHEHNRISRVYGDIAVDWGYLEENHQKYFDIISNLDSEVLRKSYTISFATSNIRSVESVMEWCRQESDLNRVSHLGPTKEDRVRELAETAETIAQIHGLSYDDIIGAVRHLEIDDDFKNDLAEAFLKRARRNMTGSH